MRPPNLPEQETPLMTMHEGRFDRLRDSFRPGRFANSRFPRYGSYAGALTCLTTLGALAWPVVNGDPEPQPRSPAAVVQIAQAPNRVTALRVEVVRPISGGQQRLTIQPGTIHAFETVDLFSKSSGFLKTQKVDIGSVAKKGETLAEIDAPEVHGEVDEADASVQVAQANLEKMAALVATSEAELNSAQAAVTESESDLDRLRAARELDEKRLERVSELYARKAISRQDVDEHQHVLEQSQAAERTGKATVEKFRIQALAAQSRVKQTATEVAVAKSSLKLAEAKAARTRVLASYTRISAPFDGVIVQRNFHPGDFIRSAVNGTEQPLLRVIRTDIMRVIVKVPDLDVPLLNVGDKATVVVDALKGREFTGVIARLGQTEDTATRTMRAEIDLPNPDGTLVDGMYGRVTIELLPPSDRLTVPSSAVMAHMTDGKGIVQVVREGAVQNTKVSLGHDDGVSVQVLDGLTADDLLISRPNRALTDGDPVAPIGTK